MLTGVNDVKTDLSEAAHATSNFQTSFVAPTEVGAVTLTTWLESVVTSELKLWIHKLQEIGVSWQSFQLHPTEHLVHYLTAAGIPHFASRDIVTLVKQELALKNAPMAIFWDMEALPIPVNLGGQWIVENIKKHVSPYGALTQFRGYSSVDVVSHVWSDLCHSGCQVIGCPERKNALQKMIIVDAMKFAYEHTNAATLCFVVNDHDFSYLFSVLQLQPCWRMIVVSKQQGLRSMSTNQIIQFCWDDLSTNSSQKSLLSTAVQLSHDIGTTSCAEQPAPDFDKVVQTKNVDTQKTEDFATKREVPDCTTTVLPENNESFCQELLPNGKTLQQEDSKEVESSILKNFRPISDEQIIVPLSSPPCMEIPAPEPVTKANAEAEVSSIESSTVSEMQNCSAILQEKSDSVPIQENLDCVSQEEKHCSAPKQEKKDCVSQTKEPLIQKLQQLKAFDEQLIRGVMCKLSNCKVEHESGNNDYSHVVLKSAVGSELRDHFLDKQSLRDYMTNAIKAGVVMEQGSGPTVVFVLPAPSSFNPDATNVVPAVALKVESTFAADGVQNCTISSKKKKRYYHTFKESTIERQKLTQFKDLKMDDTSLMRKIMCKLSNCQVSEPKSFDCSHTVLKRAVENELSNYFTDTSTMQCFITNSIKAGTLVEDGSDSYKFLDVLSSASTASESALSNNVSISNESRQEDAIDTNESNRFGGSNDEHTSCCSDDITNLFHDAHLIQGIITSLPLAPGWSHLIEEHRVFKSDVIVTLRLLYPLRFSHQHNAGVLLKKLVEAGAIAEHDNGAHMKTLGLIFTTKKDSMVSAIASSSPLAAPKITKTGFDNTHNTPKKTYSSVVANHCEVDSSDPRPFITVTSPSAKYAARQTTRNVSKGIMCNGVQVNVQVAMTSNKNLDTNTQVHDFAKKFLIRRSILDKTQKVVNLLHTLAVHDDVYVPEQYFVSYLRRRWPTECKSDSDACLWINDAVTTKNVTRFRRSDVDANALLCLPPYYQICKSPFPPNKMDVSEEELFVKQLLRKQKQGFAMLRSTLTFMLIEKFETMRVPFARKILYKTAKSNYSFFVVKSVYNQIVGLTLKDAWAALKTHDDLQLCKK